MSKTETLEQKNSEDDFSRNRSLSIRESGRHLPFQQFWDWLSGCPLNPEPKLLQRNPVLHVTDALGGYMLCVTLAFFAFFLGARGIPLVAILGLLAVSRARKCHMTIVHQAVHDQLYQLKNRKARNIANRVTAEVLGTLFWIPDFPLYRSSHAVSHHNSEELATPRDKDGKELFELGFVPGKPREYYWALLRQTATSPRFYLRDFGNRVWYSLFKAPWYRRVGAGFLSLTLGLVAWRYNAWGTLCFYAITVFPLFKLSGLLQALSEHFWGTNMELVGKLERTPLVCQGRFLFDPLPEQTLPKPERGKALLKWWVRVPYHLLVRICILSGDLPVHNDHHFHPRTKDWTSAIYANRKRMSADGFKRYHHAWSMGEALDRVFTAMAEAPPLNDNWLAEFEARS